MSILDTVKAWLRSEAHDASDLANDVAERLDSEVARREQQLAETPSEALERIQQEIEESPDLGDIVAPVDDGDGLPGS